MPKFSEAAVATKPNNKKQGTKEKLSTQANGATKKAKQNGEGLKQGQKALTPTANKAKKQPKPEKESREVIYQRIETRIFCTNPDKAPLGKDGKPIVTPFTADLAKQILGWQDEEAYAAELAKRYTTAELKNLNTTFGNDYLLTDRYGKKIRCGNNLRNRPFTQQTADNWSLEILRGKWRLNGESMIIDETGGCQDLQHRAIGLILAEQDWEMDRAKPVPEQKWQEQWKEAPYIDCIIVLGIEDRDDVIDTINTGSTRTFADALYRHSWLNTLPTPQRLLTAKTAAAATKFLWQRTEAKGRSLAPRRPHSESFEFIEKHFKLLDCVKFICEEGDGKKLTPFISLGYASTLLYLMSCATSDVEKYHAQGDESVLDWKLEDKAQEFWILFCTNATIMEPLHEWLERLDKIPDAIGRIDYQVTLFIKAWNLYSDKKKITMSVLEPVTTEDTATGLMQLSDFPRIGGIDIDHEEELEQPVEGDESADAKAARGICPKTNGPHEPITDDKDERTGLSETYCKNCLDPMPRGGWGKKK